MKDNCEDDYAGMPNKVGCDNCVKLRKQFAKSEQELKKVLDKFKSNSQYSGSEIKGIFKNLMWKN